MAKNIEINVKQNENYELLYPKSTSNIIVPSQTLVDRFGNISSIDDAIVRAGLLPQLTINTVINNVTVVVSNGEYSMSQNSIGGKAVFSLYNYGTWSIVATNDVFSRESEFEVTNVGQFEVDLDMRINMDSLTWKEISDLMEEGNITYFNVGDYKQIILNGTAGNMSFNNRTAYAVIIGINHNSSIEGNNLLHLQISLDNTNTKLLQNAQMNSATINTGGWEDCRMRTRECAQFVSCLPNDLQAVLKTVTKYTDNTGDRVGSASVVTATQDRVFLLSEFEVFGSITYSNTNEANRQQQYQWYRNHNTSEGRVKEAYDSPSAQWWWMRSPNCSSWSFCIVNSGGISDDYYVSNSNGFAPCFCV